jgi:hypothetical protein
MRFQVGDSAVDVLIDIDRFELPNAQFLPEAEPGQVESALTLLEPEHVDLERGMLIPCHPDLCASFSGPNDPGRYLRR